jgi:hypothetical protein
MPETSMQVSCHSDNIKEEPHFLEARQQTLKNPEGENSDFFLKKERELFFFTAQILSFIWLHGLSPYVIVTEATTSPLQKLAR